MVNITRKLVMVNHLLLMVALVIISTLLIDYNFIIGWATGASYKIPVSVIVLPFVFITWSSLTLFVLTRVERSLLNMRLIRYMNLPLLVIVVGIIAAQVLSIRIGESKLETFVLITLAVVNAIILGTGLNDYQRPKGVNKMIYLFYGGITVQYFTFYVVFYGMLSFYVKYDSFIAVILISTLIHLLIELAVLPIFQMKYNAKKGKTS